MDAKTLSDQMAADTTEVGRLRAELAERRVRYEMARYNPQADEDNAQAAYLREWLAKHPARRWTRADWLLLGAGVTLFLTLIVWVTWLWSVGAV